MISASIFKAKFACANGGISDSFDDVLCIGPREELPEGFKPALPIVRIIEHPAVRGQPLAIPVMETPGGPQIVGGSKKGMIGPMSGGCYVSSSDSRFSEMVRQACGRDFYGAVALHDRYETPAQYEANFD